MRNDESPQPILQVALDVPLLPGWFDYLCPEDMPLEVQQPAHVVGRRVLVPWGRQRVIGVVLAVAYESAVPLAKLKRALAVLDDIPAIPAELLALAQFAANYYQRPMGEVLLPTLPGLLRQAKGYRLEPLIQDSARKTSKKNSVAAQQPVESNTPNTILNRVTPERWQSRSVSRLLKKLAQMQHSRELSGTVTHSQPVIATPELNAEQLVAVQQLQEGLAEGNAVSAPYLLHGITGSGKTEVYLQTIAQVLVRGQQALILVPEINLTPQLTEIFAKRFPQHCIVNLHSHLADGARALAWLQAQNGQADIVLGTRLSVFVPLPRLGLIVVDEEHDPSFKQQEGLRYSARDLAVYRAHQRRIPIVLGSATPSLETWLQATRGRYQKLVLSKRAVAAQPPKMVLIDTQQHPSQHGLTEPVRQALAATLARGEQSLVFLNRRGYAPVLACAACGWLAHCQRCSAYTVWHKVDGRLRCHHCGWESAVPKHCPTCGNVDLAPLGRGTQRLEETLAQLFPAARIARVDRDSTSRKGSAQSIFNAIHAGELDILVGTQMLAKGHDFKRLTCVAILNADSALFAQDYRAPEHLFAQLLQVAGRAGRATQPGQVLIQTRYPQHPLYQALLQHDYDRFANQLLTEREQAHWPPFAYQAVLRAEAKVMDQALAFLHTARDMLLAYTEQQNSFNVYDPVPMRLNRLAGQERAQLVVESVSRPRLQHALRFWAEWLYTQKSRVRWVLEVDPLEI